MKSLQFHLSKLPDYRRKQGQRYRQTDLLVMILMGYIGGYYSGKSLGRYFKNNEEELVSLFNLSHGVPGATRINTFIKSLNFKSLNNAVYNWVEQYFQEDEKWVSIDGKALRHTLTNRNSTRQDLLNLIGAFTQKSGITLCYKKHNFNKGYEPATARELIKTFKDKGYILTLDAIHSEKKQSRLSWSQEMALSFK